MARAGDGGARRRWHHNAGGGEGDGRERATQEAPAWTVSLGRSTNPVDHGCCVVHGAPGPHEGYGLYLIYAVGFGSKGSVFIFLSPIQADGDLHGGALHVLLCLAGASPGEI